MPVLPFTGRADPETIDRQMGFSRANFGESPWRTSRSPGGEAASADDFVECVVDHDSRTGTVRRSPSPVIAGGEERRHLVVEVDVVA